MASHAKGRVLCMTESGFLGLVPVLSCVGIVLLSFEAGGCHQCSMKWGTDMFLLGRAIS